MIDLFKTGIRPAIDDFLLKKSEEERDYGQYWSASSAGYCMRKLIFDRLKVPHVKEQDARKTRVFEAGHIFHEYMQNITRDAGLSIAQEVELQDEDLMVRGHFDDLILFTSVDPLGSTKGAERQHLILYDYKTQNSGAFTWDKKKGGKMKYVHKMQLGTYMYMLRKGVWPKTTITEAGAMIKELTESRILKISKDDLRMSEEQLLWSLDLEVEIRTYWMDLRKAWLEYQETATLPPCTCADHDDGFLAREAYNDFFYEDEPCSLKWYELKKAEGLVK